MLNSVHNRKKLIVKARPWLAWHCGLLSAFLLLILPVAALVETLRSLVGVKSLGAIIFSVIFLALMWACYLGIAFIVKFLFDRLLDVQRFYFILVFSVPVLVTFDVVRRLLTSAFDDNFRAFLELLIIFAAYSGFSLSITDTLSDDEVNLEDVTVPDDQTDSNEAHHKSAFAKRLEEKRRNSEAIRARMLRKQEGVLGDSYSWAKRSFTPLELLKLGEDQINFAREPELPIEVFGLPGVDLMADAGKGLDSKAIEAGIDGEIWTAEIISNVAESHNGVTLFNGIKVTDDSKWDVDHVILWGNLVVLVDSKAYLPGMYAWHGDSIGTYPPSNRKPIRNSLKSAENEVAQQLPKACSLQSVVVVHGREKSGARSKSGIDIVGNPHGSGNPRLISAEDFAPWLEALLEKEDLPIGGPLKGVSAFRHQQISDCLKSMRPKYLLEE